MLADDLLKFNSPEAFLKAVLCMQCASGMAPVRVAGLLYHITSTADNTRYWTHSE